MQLLGEYRVIRQLRDDGASYLFVDHGGRLVVLKRLDADCLLRGQLHPSIRERLLRVRELAMKDIASLRSVERIGDDVYLIWEFIDGETFDEYVAARRLPPRQLGELGQDLVRCVESLHARGIVHGALHGRNVIVDRYGQLHLTHVSPLLYTDPAADVAALAAMLDVPLDHSIMTLRQMGQRLVDVQDTPRLPTDAAVAEEADIDRRTRRRALLGAAAATVVGVAIAAALYAFTATPASGRSPPPLGRLDDTAARR
jgi:hypothetical protein